MEKVGTVRAGYTIWTCSGTNKINCLRALTPLSGQILDSVGALLEAELKEPEKIMHFARFSRSRSVAGGAKATDTPKIRKNYLKTLQTARTGTN